jgi:hypothetical protein
LTFQIDDLVIGRKVLKISDFDVIGGLSVQRLRGRGCGRY